jgi:hypothetical protein
LLDVDYISCSSFCLTWNGWMIFKRLYSLLLKLNLELLWETKFISILYISDMNSLFLIEKKITKKTYHNLLNVMDYFVSVIPVIFKIFLFKNILE